MDIRFRDEDHWLRKFCLFADDADGDGDGGSDGGGGAGDGNDGDGDGDGGKPSGGDGDGTQGSSLLDLADGTKAADGDSGSDGGKKGAGGDAGKVGLSLETRPAYLPEQFHDPKSGEVRLEALVQSWKDGQDLAKGRFSGLSAEKLAEAGLQRIPEDAVTDGKDYELVVPDQHKDAYDRVMVPMEELGGEDPIVHKFRDIAAKHGLTKAAFNDIIQMYAIESAALLPPPIDQKAEMEKLGSQAQNVINANADFGESLKRQGLLDDAMYQEYRLTCASAAGNKLINVIRSFYGEAPIPVQVQQKNVDASGAGELRAKQAEITKLLDKGEIDSDEANRRFQALQEDYQKHYGDDAAGTSLVTS